MSLSDKPVPENRFVLVSDYRDHVLWLKDALATLGEVVVADEDSSDRVVQLVDATSSNLVFVHFDSERMLVRRRLVEELLRLKPMLLVVAVGEAPDQRLLLTLLRIGVRDYFSVGAPAREVGAQAARLLAQLPRAENEGPKSELFALMAARPGVEAATLATHLALGLVRRTGEDQPVLLLDLGVPTCDCLHYLDLHPSYTVLDAVRAVRRFDRQLVNTAFARHDSGLAVLTLPVEGGSPTDIGSADAAVLLNALRSYFRYIVINLGGMPPSELHCQVLTRTPHRLVLAEQSVYSVKATRGLVEYLSVHCKLQEPPQLVVDRLRKGLEPSADTLSESLGLPLLETLPTSGLNRLKAVNAGYSLYELAPKDPYLKAVGRLIGRLAPGLEGGERGGWLGRLRRRPADSAGPVAAQLPSTVTG